jgi:superfamily I DNA/RNA helicase
MAVTFTNKAANEMQERLKRHLDDGRTAQDMTIGTFHSVCLKFLPGGGNDVAVIDAQSALEIMSGVLRQLGVKGSPREALRAVSLVKSGSVPEEAAEVSSQVLEGYQTALEQYGAMDFDDILLRALELLESTDSESALCFQHILVDEFQDINPVQYRLIRAWCREGANLFVIGDPDQSIYGFRGTDPRCFDKFFADFPAARRIRLTQNYRSTPEILRCAQSVFADGGSKERALCATRQSGAHVRLLKADDAFSEALFVAKEINRMVGGMDMLQAHASPASGAKTSKWGFGDIAVLYRTNRQAGVLEECLLKEDIPYVVSGRHEFLSDPQVKKALSFFRFMLHPRDMASLKTYLKTCSLPVGRVERIVSDFAASGWDLDNLSASWGKSVPDLISGLPLSFETLSEYARAVKKEKPCTLIENWARDNALTGGQSMELLINTSVTYGDMASFLQNLTLGRERDVTRSGKREYLPDAVSLLTLHCSKGLEYPVVFICGVSDGLIPFRNRSGECDIGEERRLFFVGMTRAQAELVLLHSPAGSPFLSALPTEYLVTGNALPSRPKPEAGQLRLF